MKSLLQFWSDECSVSQPLETDSRVRQLVNKHVVAAFMNTFPKLATRVFARSTGELARLLFTEGEGGSFRVLSRCIDSITAARAET